MAAFARIGWPLSVGISGRLGSDSAVNLDTKTVEVNGQSLYLTRKEYQMLELLSLVFICKLRKKLAKASGGRDYIETVWGRGYVLREASDEAPIAVVV